MSKHRVGMHWIRTHPDGRDLAHVEAMQYPSVKLFEWHWSDRNACRDLLTVLPRDSYILARDHPLSEQKQDMWNDPVGTGIRHANEWAIKVSMGNYHMPTERTFFLGINEPDATSGDRNAIDTYTTAFLDRLRVHGLRGGAFNFSTGHPRTADGTPNTSPDYTVFESSHQAIQSGHHIGILHIYGTATVPCAPGHYDRLKACPWQDVEWVVGECAIDQHVLGGGAHDGYLRALPDKNAYCRWLDELIMGIGDPRIHSYQVFSYDFSHPWDSFDVRPIRDALESYDWQHAKRGNAPLPDSKPYEVSLPSVHNDSGAQPPSGPTAVVSVPAGANIRTGPGTSHSALGAVPSATPLQVVGKNQSGDWWQVLTEWGTGWVSATVVKTHNVNGIPVTTVNVIQPVPQPQGDKWQRSLAFTARWESGYQNVHNDAGNWTGGKVGVGELKGTNFGISAASYPNLDIKNLTRQQANDIYRRDYWIASGADQLPWPACLIVFDTAVLHGVGTAKAWLQEVGANPLIFAAKRLRSYTKMGNWDFWGKAWVQRVSDLLEEAAK
jgi:hypothetical protein